MRPCVSPPIPLLWDLFSSCFPYCSLPQPQWPPSLSFPTWRLYSSLRAFALGHELCQEPFLPQTCTAPTPSHCIILYSLPALLFLGSNFLPHTFMHVRTWSTEIGSCIYMSCLLSLQYGSKQARPLNCSLLHLFSWNSACRSTNICYINE